MQKFELLPNEQAILNRSEAARSAWWKVRDDLECHLKKQIIAMVYKIRRKSFLSAFPELRFLLVRYERARGKSFSPSSGSKKSNKHRRPFLAPTAEELRQLRELGVPAMQLKGLNRYRALDLLGRLKTGTPKSSTAKPRGLTPWQIRRLNAEPREATERQATWLKNHTTGPYDNARKR